MDAFMKFMTVLIVVVLAYAGWQVVTGSNVFANAVVFAVGCPILGIMIWAWLDDPKRSPRLTRGCGQRACLSS